MGWLEPFKHQGVGGDGGPGNNTARIDKRLKKVEQDIGNVQQDIGTVKETLVHWLNGVH